MERRKYLQCACERSSFKIYEQGTDPWRRNPKFIARNAAGFHLPVIFGNACHRVVVSGIHLKRLERALIAVITGRRPLVPGAKNGRHTFAGIMNPSPTTKKRSWRSALKKRATSTWQKR
jgi:hypothetical protein